MEELKNMITPTNTCYFNNYEKPAKSCLFNFDAINNQPLKLNKLSCDKVFFSSNKEMSDNKELSPIYKRRQNFLNNLPSNIKFPLNTAHRGFSSKYPENTMSAFTEALYAGADVIEMDVALTKDKKIAVIHDDTLDRTTNGKGKVSDYTLAEIQKLDAGAKFAERFKGEKIPTLNEVFDKLGKKILMNVEIKDPHNPDSTIEKQVVDLIHKDKLEDFTLVQSFNHNSLNKVKKYDPSIKTAVLHWGPLKDVDPVAETKDVDGISFNPDAQYVTPEIVDKVHKAGIMIMPYFVDNVKKENIQKMLDMGVDSVISNNPDIMKKITEK
jgi:glycerophosphoryl diester phosphodiesterase